MPRIEMRRTTKRALQESAPSKRAAPSGSLAKRATRAGVEAAMRTLESDDDVRKGMRALRRKCEHLARVHDHAGDPPLRRHAPGFEGLARIIVGQQLSIASAEAIWGRLKGITQPMHPEAFARLSDEALRTAGLSRGKVRTLRAVSEAMANGLDLDRLQNAREEDVHEALTALPGIGPWSADIYLLFCLGRADAFAPGDLALQTAARHALGLTERPSREALMAIAERWRPWRGVAAHMLWAFYKVAPMGLTDREKA